MNPLVRLMADMTKRANAVLDNAERIMLSTLDDSYTLEPGDVDRNGNTYASEEFERLDELADKLNRQNIVYIQGIAYELAMWGDPFPDGSRKAVLRVWRPF